MKCQEIFRSGRSCRVWIGQRYIVSPKRIEPATSSSLHQTRRYALVRPMFIAGPTHLKHVESCEDAGFCVHDPSPDAWARGPVLRRPWSSLRCPDRGAWVTMLASSCPSSLVPRPWSLVRASRGRQTHGLSSWSLGREVGGPGSVAGVLVSGTRGRRTWLGARRPGIVVPGTRGRRTWLGVRRLAMEVGDSRCWPDAAGGVRGDGRWGVSLKMRHGLTSCRFQVTFHP